MSESRETKHAYARGYYRGYKAAMSRLWPNDVPLPPDELWSALLVAAKGLRDAADALCARIDETDEWHQELAPKIDMLDSAMANLKDTVAAMIDQAREKA